MSTYTLNDAELAALAEGADHDAVCGIPRPNVPGMVCARRAGHADGMCMSAEHLRFIARAAAGEDFPWLLETPR